MLERENDLMSCSLTYAFYTIGGKWKPYIIWYLSISPSNTSRYGELKRHIPWNISHKMFSQQLKELEKDGLLTRAEYFEEKIPKVEYTLTEKAMFLVPVIRYMRDWGAVFGEGFSESTIFRTLGEWKDDSLNYDHHSKDDSGMNLHISFNIGITNETIDESQAERPVAACRNVKNKTALRIDNRAESCV